ncbi:MAG: DUF952 domain-containing protein [Cyanobacteria bacterium J06621_12]
MSQRTYHITSADEWLQAQENGYYQSARFAQEKFIHLSYSHQLLTVAHRFYTGQKGLVILVIDSSKIKDGLIEENLEGGIELYPHFYGVLSVDTVLDAIAFTCNADGSFNLPVGLLNI